VGGVITDAELSVEPGEATTLRRYLRDLVALSTLPAVWVGQSPQLIVEGFTDALHRTMGVDFVYARVSALSGGGPVIESVSTERGGANRRSAREIGRTLAPWLDSHDVSRTTMVRSPLDDDGEVTLAVAMVGHAGGILGVVAAGTARDDFASDYDRLLMRVGANQLAIALQGAQLESARAELAKLEERQRLARELHDSVSQALYAIVLDISAAQELRTIDPSRLVEILADARSVAEMGLTEMRSLIFELRPEALEREGLVAALSRGIPAVQARHRLPIKASLGVEPDIPLAAKEVLYRVAQEALQNSARHAGARNLSVSLDTQSHELFLRVRDDGRGFDPQAAFPGHLGLRSMQERVESVGGVFHIRSNPHGTEVSVRIPLDPRASGN
jgi:signal transduction histidine kinase